MPNTASRAYVYQLHDASGGYSESVKLRVLRQRNLSSQKLLDPAMLEDPAIYPDSKTLNNLYVTTPYPPKVQRVATRTGLRSKRVNNFKGSSSVADRQVAVRSSLATQGRQNLNASSPSSVFAPWADPDEKPLVRFDASPNALATYGHRKPVARYLRARIFRAARPIRLWQNHPHADVGRL